MTLPCHVQILGKDREKVAALGRQLGLDGTYIPHSFIEQVRLWVAGWKNEQVFSGWLPWSVVMQSTRP